MKWKSPFLLSALAFTLLTSRPCLVTGQNAPPPLATLHNFAATDAMGENDDGNYPEAALVQGSDGNLYGVAYQGGSEGFGTVYQITPAGVLTTLHHFAGGDTEGRNPAAALVQGSDGNFYGTTVYGGSHSDGTVFKMTPAGAFTNLHVFSGVDSDGINPRAKLIEGRDGNFYGTTYYGGSGGNGTVFKITPAGVLTTIHNFTKAGTEGAYPEAALIRGNDGNFYGTTYGGGGHGQGAIFQITPAGELTTLYSFSAVDRKSRNADGAGPHADLVLGRDGNFYGTALVGGSFSNGTIFKITPAGAFTALHHFTDADGAYSYAALVQASDGNFYGTTYAGGSNGTGTLFQLTPAGAYAVLYHFTGDTNGAMPLAGLVQGRDGSLYGTTVGIFGGQGTVFVFGAGKPVVLSAASAKGTLGTRFDYQIVAAGVPTRFAVDGLGGQMHVDARTGVISGYPLGMGTHTLTLHAFNAKGEGTQTLLLTVDREAPVITSPLTASAVEGQPFSYQITADNDPSQFQVVRLIPDLHVDARTGLISGTPTASGTFRLTLKAVNGKGTGTALLKLSVAPQ